MEWWRPETLLLPCRAQDTLSMENDPALVSTVLMRALHYYPELKPSVP
jgi:hypothetical protein